MFWNKTLDIAWKVKATEIPEHSVKFQNTHSTLTPYMYEITLLQAIVRPAD